MTTEPLFLPYSQPLDDSPPPPKQPMMWSPSQEEEAPSSMAPPYQQQRHISPSPPPESQPAQSQPSQLSQPPSQAAQQKRILETQEDEQSVSKILRTGSKEEDDHRSVRDIVGVLLGEVDGIGKTRLVIRLHQIILIGRSPTNDLTLNYPAVSRRHLRFSPVRTSSELTMVSVTDMSSSGFYLNDVFHRPSRQVEINKKRYRCMTYILNERDKIRLPGCPTVFTFYQGPFHQNKGPDPVGIRLFKTPQEPRYLISQHWVVHNFQLGDGSFGVVHLASHRIAAWFQVACKTVKIEDEEDRLRHRNEVNLLKRMAHPNVNGIIDLFHDSDPNRVHMVLEMMAGGDLFAYQEKHGALSEPEVRWFGWQLVQGLEYLHKMAVAHRDLKPENILLAVSCIYPRVVICDFGHSIDYASMLDKTPRTEYDAAVRHIPHIGTASYIPPERLKMWLRPPPTLKGWGEDLPAIRGVDGKKGMSRRERLAYLWFDEEKLIDSWSLGVTLFVTATQHHPYETGAAASTVPLTPTPSHKLTAAQSWASFRQGSGMGSSLGRSFISPEEAEKLRNLLEGCRMTPYLFDGSRFTDFSTEGKNFLRGLLEPGVTKRIRISQASKHAWFTSQRKVIDALWEKVVVEGRVLHPDTAEELIAACSEEEYPPSQASQASYGAAPDESFSIQTFHNGNGTANNTFGRARREEHSMEEIEDPGESHLPQTNEEIEVDETENMTYEEETYTF